MNKATFILFLVWIALSILDMVALFANVPLFFSITFAILNFTVIVGSVPVFVQWFKDRKYEKMMKEEPDEL